MSNAIVPIMSVNDALVRYEAVKHLASEVMVRGTDYGVIPGTTKPTLLKPGAEKLCSFFGMSPFFEITEKVTDWTGKDFNGEPFFYFSYRCSLHLNGVVIAQGEGSCNSWEKKYRWRDATPVCPNCGKMTIYKSKPPQNGWYCWNKKGGCGATFKAGDKSIESQATGQMPNPDIADIVNTLQKMAQKRALIAAVLIGANASEFFTQDLEDFAPSHIDGEWLEVKTDRETGEIVQEKKAPPAPPAPVEKVLVADLISEIIQEYPGCTITEALNAINKTPFVTDSGKTLTTEIKISKTAGNTIKQQVKTAFDGATIDGGF